MTLPGRCSPLEAVGVLGHGLQPPRREQLGEVRRVVDDPVVAAQLAVLVADGVEAVRAGGDDRPLPHPVAVQRRDVPGREDLEHVVVAHAARRVARARLLLPEHREPDARGMQAGRDGAGHLLVARVEGRRAADPVEDLELVQPAVGGHRGDGLDLELERLRPVEPRRGGLPPRVALVLHRAERPGQLLREPRVLEDEVAPQPDDLVDVLDEDRAGLDARAAGHAVPDRVVGDGRVDDRGAQRGRAGRSCRRGRRSRGRSASSG